MVVSERKTKIDIFVLGSTKFNYVSPFSSSPISYLTFLSHFSRTSLCKDLVSTMTISCKDLISTIYGTYIKFNSQDLVISLSS